jgi:hypothetical protein
MNLFVLDKDPELAATMLDDKRIGTALRECCQMMSVAALNWSETGVEFGPGLACKPTHQHHPVTLWVSATRANYLWTLHYANALWNEHHVRYGTWHTSGERLEYLRTFRRCLTGGSLLPFQNSARHQGLGLDFTHLPVPISYQQYLMERWKTDARPAKFTNRQWPEFAKQCV